MRKFGVLVKVVLRDVIVVKGGLGGRVLVGERGRGGRKFVRCVGVSQEPYVVFM